MNEHEYIKKMISIWGEDYIFDLIDRGYEPIELVDNGKQVWKLVLADRITDLTQTQVCATIPASRSVVSPVSTV